MSPRARRRPPSVATRSFTLRERSAIDFLARTDRRSEGARAKAVPSGREKEPHAVAGAVRFAPAPDRVIGTGGEEEGLVAPAGSPAGMPASVPSGRIGRDTALMMGGTLLSRVTGLLRLLVASYALGIGFLSDSFNLANNTPNIVHDLVLGGILSATFVPVFVDRLNKERPEEANESISAVVTLASVLLAVATVVFVLIAPLVVDLYSLGTHTVRIGLERHLATELLRMFALQLLGYGAISIMTAVLNTARRFALPAYVPVVNNLVAIAVLLEFAAVAHHPTIAGVSHDSGLILFLGFGTTAGVLLQALFLVPSTLRCGIRLRVAWAPRSPAVAEVLSLSGWTLGFVVANQIALFVSLALAVHISSKGGAVTAYTYAFTFFQLPYGMIAVSVMSAVTPELAHRFSIGDRGEMARQFGVGMRRMMAGIWPATLGYLLLAGPIMKLLLLHGAARPHGVALTGTLLALLATGLPGYCVFLLAIRALQAMRDTRTAFFLYVLENGLNVVLVFALTPVIGADGLAVALSGAYTVAAVAALLVARHKMGGLGGWESGRFVGRSFALSVVMAFAVAAATVAVGSSSGVGLVERVAVGVLVGVLVYGGGAALAGSAARALSRRRRGLAGRGA